MTGQSMTLVPFMSGLLVRRIWAEEFVGRHFKIACLIVNAKLDRLIALWDPHILIQPAKKVSMLFQARKVVEYLRLTLTWI